MIILHPIFSVSYGSKKSIRWHLEKPQCYSHYILCMIGEPYKKKLKKGNSPFLLSDKISFVNLWRISRLALLVKH